MIGTVLYEVFELTYYSIKIVYNGTSSLYNYIYPETEEADLKQRVEQLISVNNELLERIKKIESNTNQ